MSSLLAALRKLAQSRGRDVNLPALAEAPPAISWETVESVQEDGYALVRGKPIAATGTKTFEANERVPVTWKDGRPQAILGHRWRRAQFGQTFRAIDMGIIEELLIGNFDDLGEDVWYRNFERLEKLNVSDKCNGRILEVKWGYDGKSFAVKAGDGWYTIFAMDRDPTKSEEQWEPKRIWEGQPLTASTLILTFSARTSNRYNDVYGKATEQIHNIYEDRNGGPQWYETSYAAGFETEELAGGTASGTAARYFTLVQLLAGQDDGSGGSEAAQVVDWYLDGDQKLKFLISVSLDHFTVSSPDGSGTRVSLYWVSGDDAVDGYEDTSEAPIGSLGGYATVGGVKQDLTRVPETHFFTYNAVTQTLEFSSFLPASLLGQEQNQAAFSGRIDRVERFNVNSPTSPPRAHAIQYYSGAETGGDNDLFKNVSLPPDGSYLIGNLTAQLFRDGLSYIPGPYVDRVVTPGGFGSGAALFSRTNFHWSDQFNTSVDVRLWHYTVQDVKLFQSNTESRLFLVMARYPFLGGTGYLNDIPQIGIFILNARTGALVETIRDWQYGLAGAGFVGANAHRIVWTLSSPWIEPKTVYKTTNILTGKETEFSLAQVTDLLQTQMAYLQPDFLWTHEDPNRFYLPDSLPDIEEDAVIEDLGKLVILSDNPVGSTRAANDEAILDPLGRYNAT